jgi:hypothetical protein
VEISGTNENAFLKKKNSATAVEDISGDEPGVHAAEGCLDLLNKENKKLGPEKETHRQQCNKELERRNFLV